MTAWALMSVPDSSRRGTARLDAVTDLAAALPPATSDHEIELTTSTMTVMQKYLSQADVGRLRGVSRQAVTQARKRHNIGPGRFPDPDVCVGDNDFGWDPAREQELKEWQPPGKTAATEAKEQPDEPARF